MATLRDAGVFRLRPLVTNFRAKLSTVTEYDPHRQIICLVSEDNEILLRYTNDSGADVLKLISWFKRSGRVVHDVNFDPTGIWLLVLCFDNTLHIVPALFVLDNTFNLDSTPFSTSEITSFVIPFVGPHECPNSKCCPNNNSSEATSTSSPVRLADYTDDRSNQRDDNNEYNFIPNRITVPPGVDETLDPQNVPYKVLDPVRQNSGAEETATNLTHSTCTKVTKRQETDATTSTTERTNSTNNDSIESFMSSATCPYPICVAWWQALDQRNRAIIGYSDGTLCFVGLTPNCPFISTSSIENGSVIKLIVCRDNSMQNVTLLINSSNKEQWKLLLEQKSINYTFPGDSSPTHYHDNNIKDDWQFVTPIKSDTSGRSSSNPGDDDTRDSRDSPAPSAPPPPENSEQMPSTKSGLLPAARARFALLKDGAKKLIAMKMKLSDPSRSKAGESASEDSLSSFAIMESPTMIPEILTSPPGPYFIVQNLRNTFLLSALHSYSDTLSVHRMDVSLIPVFLYKIPSDCQDVLICSNVLYSTQIVPCSVRTDDSRSDDETARIAPVPEGDCEAEDAADEHKKIPAVGVISSAMASIKNGEDVSFNESSLLSLFKFPDEAIINVHRMVSFPNLDKPTIVKDESNDTLQSGEIKSPSSYVRLQRNLQGDEFFPLRDSDVMLGNFPQINYDPCIVVTNRNTYFIELNNEPRVIFLNAAIVGDWIVCEEFCNTFDLSFPQCIEFAGDLLLRRKKITQALFTYNVGRIPPVRTALKLAMFGENFALMQLCALALKSMYILKSKFPSHRLIRHILVDADKRHCEKVVLPGHEELAENADSINNLNVGVICSDYAYGSDEILNTLQMSASSQFHLSNLLLMTLAEKTVRDKNYFPIWNFIASNLKYHTNMTSIVLCQSGLYSTSLLLAMIRGACFDVFTGMVSVLGQEFGWYSELNVILYNLSENVFRETITYLRYISVDYLNTIQSKLEKIEVNVLQRLEQQLNPFLAVYRPVVSQNSARNGSHDANDENGGELLEFCKIFIETYLAVAIQIEAHKMRRDNFVNALYNFRINYEDNQFAIKSSNFSPLSAGCSHCACVIDGLAYFWGSNGVPCVYTNNKLSEPPDPPHTVKCLDILAQLNLEIHAVKCGRQHSLVLTNNGLYACGINQLGQLGIGKLVQAALQPTLIETLDNKNITILEAGQYHNAVVADKQLYTWGWGIYGQLGHKGVENAYTPTVVDFFKDTDILQISLGHAHSIVLCDDFDRQRKLFVFGSNQFGQLGTGIIEADSNSSPYKSLRPVELVVDSTSPIRLIHTKFFTSFAVNDKNELYIWGSSPQALRLANQVKKRANAKSKIEESFKREINRRNEALASSISNSSQQEREMPSPPKDIIIPVPSLIATSSRSAPCFEVPKSQSDSQLSDIAEKQTDNELNRRSSESNITDKNKSATTWYYNDIPSTSGFEQVSADRKEADIRVLDPEATFSDDADQSVEEETAKVDEMSSAKIEATDSKKPEKNVDGRSSNLLDEDIGDHMTPQKVDTSEVSGEILQVSSGLFHSAIVSSTSMLYTWGKNLEHQLGTEDKERRTVIKPFTVETIENPMYVECGADFTLVMTTDYVVKAFGGNSSGQCGRDLGPPSEKSKAGKLFSIPTTKRLMRLEGHCVESPCEINLPRPRIHMGSEPTRYLKSVPKFKHKYIVQPSLGLGFNRASSLMQFQEFEDFASSIENISLNDDDSLCSATIRIINLSSNDASPADDILSGAPPPPQFNPPKSPGRVQHSTVSRKPSDELDISFRHYIHYCLYIFHGLYDSQRIADLSQCNLEFRIRILMLNYRYVDAFTLCVNECRDAQKSIRIFEYFTKDPSIVPMRRKDLKFFIHQLFIHFIANSLDLNICEDFFIGDLDYYLLELAYVLYFNNNNTELEQSMNQKFKVLFEQDIADNQDYNLEDTDAIFDSLSVRFKAMVCQGMLRICEN